MVVEFVGGSLDGKSQTIPRYFDYMNTDIGEVYIARAIQYKNLGWIYVWYEMQGTINPGEHEIYA